MPRFISRWSLATIALVPVFSFSQPAQTPAQQPEEGLCFMQTASGQVLSLNQLCGRRQATVNLSATDQQFLADYQRTFQTRVQGSPWAQVSLRRIQQNPQALIQRARDICNPPAIAPAQSTPVRPQPSRDGDILAILAPRYYCPERND